MSRELVPLPPRPSSISLSMRDIGYTIETAVADLIDNSISAGAKRIELLADTVSDPPVIGILDDGHGLSKDELLEAMRFGSQSPLETRKSFDLGRFGLGLKTASLSQCRRVTVITRKDGATSAAVWDLDLIEKKQDWVVECPTDQDLLELPWFDRLVGDGTLVLWDNLDRVIGDGSDLVEKIDSVATHIEFIFHRFLTQEGRHKKIDIAVNGRPLCPWDPFCLYHSAVQIGPPEKEGEVHIQAVTLPHHSKTKEVEWKRNGGTDGYLRNQGFYLYRNRRLIVHGTWFRLAPLTELTKLCRVRIDIPNHLDAAWKIDVKKASATPPAPVREKLKSLIEPLHASSKRTYTGRGTTLTEDTPIPVWNRIKENSRITYGLNPEHPVFSSLRDDLDEDTKEKFDGFIELVLSTLPIDALFADVGSEPQDVQTAPMSSEHFEDALGKIYVYLRKQNMSRERIEKILSRDAPFSSDWEYTLREIDRIEQEMR